MAMRENECNRCGRKIIGPAFFRHIKACKGQKTVAVEVKSITTPELFKLDSKYAVSYLTQLIMGCEETIKWSRSMIDMIHKQESKDYQDGLAKRVSNAERIRELT
jgi:L-lactate utilization protein LutB